MQQSESFIICFSSVEERLAYKNVANTQPRMGLFYGLKNLHIPIKLE